MTLRPRSHVSFNIKTPSATFLAIKASGSFTVSGLVDERTAHAFVAKGLGDGGGESWKGMIEERGSVRADRGGTWWMVCKYRSGLSTRVEDHMIVVGEVVEAGGEEKWSGEGGEAKGLVYLNGKYRNVGEVGVARQ